MIYKWLRKVKNVVCLIVMVCIIIPLVSACGESENELPSSYVNKIIGVGNNIDAYTTYNQARFVEMDRDLYYSYLMNMREFILVVLPQEKDSDGKLTDQPVRENLMFQAIYNGVTPYGEDIINGNFTFERPEYKLLIYYVFAEDLLKWDEDARNEGEEESFVKSALDFLGPASTTVKGDMEKKMVNYTLRNLVNNSDGLSECDFLVVDDKYNIADYTNLNKNYAVEKCGVDKNVYETTNKLFPLGKNVVADVAKGTSQGLTLLYGEYSLEGYFTYEQVNEYNFNNVRWVKNLLSYYNNDLQTYVNTIVNEYMCKNDYTSDHCTVQARTDYVANMTYKLKYDMSLLGRIDNIHYNTLLDINTSSTVHGGINTEKYKDDIQGYNKLLSGDSSVNGGDYVAFTTANGFILDRGNLILGAAEDVITGENFLGYLTQIDACTNRTLASYVAEILADVGIVAGGIATVVAGGALVGMGVVAGLASAGVISASVPGVGWFIGAALLLVAGVAALAVSISAKKAINETSSANYCEVYKDAIKEILDMSYVRVPIYNYNIKEDKDYTTDLCFDSYVVNPASGKEECGKLDDDGNFVASKYGVPVFKMADLDEMSVLEENLSGAPSLRLYSKGKLVDEIYGAASAQFIYQIMDSWGLTSAANMKFYSSLDDNQDVVIYDLLKMDANRKTTIKSAKYCFSTKYGEECIDGNNVKSPVLKYSDFNSSTGMYTLFNSSIIKSGRDAIINEQKNKLNSYDLDGYYNDLMKADNDISSINVKVSENEGLYTINIGSGLKIVDVEETVDEITTKYYHLESNDGTKISLTKSASGNYHFFNYAGNSYRLYKHSDGTYSVKRNLTSTERESVSGNLNTVINRIDKELINVDVSSMKEQFVEDYIDSILNGNTSSVVNHFIYTKLENELFVNIPIYINITIVEEEKDKNGKVINTASTTASALYENAVIRRD